MQNISLKPYSIYQQIKDELELVVRSINGMSTDEALREAKSNAKSALDYYQEDLNKQLQDLQKNSEWDRFIIAFYGETGTGKSTLIETLRIVLNEPTKAHQRAQFLRTLEQIQACTQRIAVLEVDIYATRELRDRLALQMQSTRERFVAPQEAAQQAIDAADIRYKEAKEQLQAQLNTTKVMLTKANQEVQRLNNYLADYKKSASLWTKFKGLFIELPERQKLLKAQRDLQDTMDIHASSVAQTQAAQDRWEKERTALVQQLTETLTACEQACAQVEQEAKRTEQKLVKLESEKQSQEQQRTQLTKDELPQHADGGIIGNGLSDTTKKTHQYNFSLGGQDFALLDVPGIEGNEATVIDQIEIAVQKAHAVFYITNKPSAPQKGDGSTKGTLEKIKTHLGAQTEIWSIYNKRITNPKQSLKDKTVITSSEQETIEAPDASGLNFSMREQLGQHYRETIALAALPALLASTDHFILDSQNHKNRSKAMKDFTPEELLQNSGLNDFVEFLRSSLVVDAKARIQRSNFNKAHEALQTTLNKLQAVKDNFSTLCLELEKKEVDAKSLLDSSLQSLQIRLKTSGSKIIQTFESTVRKEVYSRIDDDISNDEFKSTLGYHVEQQQQRLQKELPYVMEQEIERFKSDVQNVVERFAEQAHELSAIYALLNQTQLESNIGISINVNNGIKIGSLLLSLGGAIAAVLGSGGWVLALGLAGLAFSFAKAVWGFFDSDFKKSEQRKSTNENLNKIAHQLNKSLDSSINSAMPELLKKVGMIEQALEVPARETRELVRILDYSKRKLTSTSIQIKSLGRL
jgi:hypothetical protein